MRVYQNANAIFKTHFESRNGLFFAFRELSTYRLKVVRLWICILIHPQFFNRRTDDLHLLGLSP